MFKILMITGFLFNARASQIIGHGSITADYGGDAQYRCALDNPTGVLQVTWQRLFKDESIENLATYSKRFGEQVNEPYQGKVVFTKASLNSTSIMLMNVTWEDESCYICSFNAYPDGSQRKQTCLTVEGISEVKTHGHVVKDHEGEDKEVVFSCSATGKPAPTIQWVVSPAATSQEESQASTETNSDHTYTSSCNMTLTVAADWTGHVACLVNSGMRGQRQEPIPFDLPLRKKKEGGRSSFGIALVLTAVFISSMVVATAVIKRKKSNGNRRIENVT